MSTQTAVTESIKYCYREIRQCIGHLQAHEFMDVDAARLEALLDVQEILTGRDRQDILLSVLTRINNDDKVSAC